ALAAVAAAAALGAGALARSSGPLERLQDLGRRARESPRAALAELWARDGYGTASARMIAEHPWTGIGVGCVHHFMSDYTVRLVGARLPPDNAQCWYRHQLAELGLLGSLGWIGWIAVAGSAVLLGRARERRPDVVTTRWVLAGVAAISLVAMPGQHPAVALTIWTFAFLVLDAVEPKGLRRIGDRLAHPASQAVVWIAVLAFWIACGHAALGELRVPWRAKRFDFDYAHGITVEAGADAGTTRAWTRRRAVIVPEAPASAAGSPIELELTARVEHPDADERPVRVRIRIDGARLVDRRFTRGVPLVERVRIPAGSRFVLETAVDRTYRPAGCAAETCERGLALAWRFRERAGR
ncbi:MAG TPA: hypothetical protein VNK92_00355, partial [Vicinamibacterales bacterium]|nr:hypothetical protein [Vicinamibacterales bacterium]